MINRSNYEVWFIDYADGKLSHEHVAELLLFLEENPDLKNEFGFFEPVELTVDKVEFPFKEDLKKTKPSKAEFDDIAVRFLENDLSAEEKKKYELWIKDFTDLKVAHNLFAHTKLHADKNVIFQNKSKLKKKAGRVVFMPWMPYQAAAACVVAFMIFYANRNEPVKQQQAEHKTNYKPEQERISPPVEVEETKTDSKNTIALASNKNSTETAGIVKHSHQKSMSKVSRENSTITIALIEPKVSTIETTVNPEPLQMTHIENTYALVMKNTESQPDNIQGVIKEVTLKKLNALADNVVGMPVENSKQKTLAIFGKIVNRITFRRVNIETIYSDDGKLMAYAVSAGHFNFEHEVVK
jgi:hypothetical protein